MEELKQQFITIIGDNKDIKLNHLTFNTNDLTFDVTIDDFEEVTITFDIITKDIRNKKNQHLFQILNPISYDLRIHVYLINGVIYSFHPDQHNYGYQMITGYLKVRPNYFNLRSRIPNTYLNEVPSEILSIIIEYLNRLDITVLILDMDVSDNIFKNLISHKGIQVFKVLSQFKKHLELSWTQLYLLFYKVMKIDPEVMHDFDDENMKLFEHARDDPVCRYLFKTRYNDLYDYLSKFEKIKKDTSEPQFYLTYTRWGFDWSELYSYMVDQNDGILGTIEAIANDNLDLDIIYALKLTEEYGVDYSHMEGDYIRETFYNLKDVDDPKWRDTQIKLIKFIYNYTGDNAGITSLRYPELFKWFRGHDQDSEIKNTYGPVEYFDLDDLSEMWADEYVEAGPEDRKIMDETLKFIAEDNPQFNLDEFYREANLI
jgi:hypothetical protein